MRTLNWDTDCDCLFFFFTPSFHKPNVCFLWSLSRFSRDGYSSGGRIWSLNSCHSFHTSVFMKPHISCSRCCASDLTPSSGRWFPARCSSVRGAKVRAPQPHSSRRPLTSSQFSQYFPLVAKVFHSWLEGKWTFRLSTFLTSAEVSFYLRVSHRSVCGETGFLSSRLRPSLQHQHSPECPISPRRSGSQPASLFSWSALNWRQQTEWFMIVSNVLERREKRFGLHFQTTAMPACVLVH